MGWACHAQHPLGPQGVRNSNPVCRVKSAAQPLKRCRADQSTAALR